jgi:hypothetical protein
MAFGKLGRPMPPSPALNAGHGAPFLSVVGSSRPPAIDPSAGRQAGELPSTVCLCGLALLGAWSGNMGVIRLSANNRFTVDTRT